MVHSIAEPTSKALAPVGRRSAVRKRLTSGLPRPVPGGRGAAPPPHREPEVSRGFLPTGLWAPALRRVLLSDHHQEKLAHPSRFARYNIAASDIVSGYQKGGPVSGPALFMSVGD
jgi:hypothetical protein